MKIVSMALVNEWNQLKEITLDENHGFTQKDTFYKIIDILKDTTDKIAYTYIKVLLMDVDKKQYAFIRHKKGLDYIYSKALQQNWIKIFETKSNNENYKNLFCIIEKPSKNYELLRLKYQKHVNIIIKLSIILDKYHPVLAHKTKKVKKEVYENKEALLKLLLHKMIINLPLTKKLIKDSRPSFIEEFENIWHKVSSDLELPSEYDMTQFMEDIENFHNQKTEIKKKLKNQSNHHYLNQLITVLGYLNPIDEKTFMNKRFPLAIIRDYVGMLDFKLGLLKKLQKKKITQARKSIYFLPVLSKSAIQNENIEICGQTIFPILDAPEKTSRDTNQPKVLSKQDALKKLVQPY